MINVRCALQILSIHIRKKLYGASCSEESKRTNDLSLESYIELKNTEKAKDFVKATEII